MSDEPSPWPERRRTQALLFAAGAACMLPAAAHFGGLAELGGTFVVGTSAVGSALLIYGLLGWGGQWAAPEEEVASGATGDDGDAVADADEEDGDDEHAGAEASTGEGSTEETADAGGSSEDTPSDPSDPGDGETAGDA